MCLFKHKRGEMERCSATIVSLLLHSRYRYVTVNKLYRTCTSLLVPLSEVKEKLDTGGCVYLLTEVY